MEKKMETNIGLRVWGLAMEKKMETTIMGYIGTAIHSFIPSLPKARLLNEGLMVTVCTFPSAYDPGCLTIPCTSLSASRGLKQFSSFTYPRDMQG